MGDFGNYEIQPRLAAFAAVPLSKTKPISNQELFDRFEREVIHSCPGRVEAFAELRSAQMANFGVTFRRGDGEVFSDEAYRVAIRLLEAERHLLSMLTPGERRRYRNEAANRIGSGRKKAKPELPTLDLGKARRWVSKRAYELGWTKAFFPQDSSRYRNHSRERPYVERIGKKYQRIAFDELLCRLADNYWMGARYGDSAKKYDNPLDVGFERDIDPTIIPITDASNTSQGARPKWVLGEDITLDLTSEEQLTAWPFKVDPAERFRYLIQTR